MGAPRQSRPSDDWIGYAIAFAVVAGLGAVLRSVVLNWIVGPALVVAIVVGYERWRTHRTRGAP